ncbi:MAG: RDD family protein [Oligoflexia bacterium]|nr:RDD family protein [Oligoflexia bacterium]
MAKRQPKYSQRALAYSIDLLTVYLITITCVFAIVSCYLLLQTNPRESWDHLKVNQGYRIFQSFAHLVVYISYFTISFWSYGKTIGKSFFKLSVVSEKDDELTFGQSLGRSFAYLLSGQLTLGIGFLLPLFREDKKALHDLLAKTKVIRIDSNETIDQKETGPTTDNIDSSAA